MTYIKIITGRGQCSSLGILCLKSKEFNLVNGLRNAEKENTSSEAEPDFLFELLTGEKMPAVATMEELRKIFKIKSMNRSEEQIRQLKCSVEA